MIRTISLLALSSLLSSTGAIAADAHPSTLLRLLIPSEAELGKPVVMCMLNEGSDATIERRADGGERIRLVFPGVPVDLDLATVEIATSEGWEARPELQRKGVLAVGLQPLADPTTLEAGATICVQVSGFDPFTAPIGLEVVDPLPASSR